MNAESTVQSPQSTGLSLRDAKVCLDASAAAYTRPATIATSLTHCLILSPQSTVQSPQRTIVAFRGSASLRDWVTDLECRMIERGARDITGTGKTDVGAGERIHHGFLDALLAESFAEKLSAWWGRPWPTMPIYVTGHSLGGAMAVLAAEMLVRAGAPVAGVYTFGGPRVGNAAFARNYDSLKVASAADPASAPGAREATLGDRTFRFVDEEDIVPRIPFWHWGYRHVGQECFLPSVIDMGAKFPGVPKIFPSMRLNPSLGFKLISDVVGTWIDWRHGEIAQIVDHPVGAYQRRLGPMFNQVEDGP